MNDSIRNTSELIAYAAYRGAHHVRLNSQEGDIVAHAGVVDGQWQSTAASAINALYERIDRQAPSGVCRWADSSKKAAFAAIEGLLSAAIASGGLTPEMKIETWHEVES